MVFKAVKPDSRILILQIIVASILGFSFHSEFAVISLFLVIDFCFLLVWGKSFHKAPIILCSNVWHNLGIYDNKHPNSICDFPPF